MKISEYYKAIGFKAILVSFVGLILCGAVLYKGGKKALHYARENHYIYHRHPESQLAHKLLDHLTGIEIGASAQNPFNLKALNVDFTDDLNTVFKEEERLCTGTCAQVHIVAPGDKLPLEDGEVDFVISSHAIEHFYDPIKTMQEWLRVVRPGGYVYVIVPHKERTFDKDRPRTTLAELIDRHERPDPPVPDHHGHYSVWITQDFEELATHMKWKVVAIQDVDDKVGNGFTIVIQK